MKTIEEFAQEYAHGDEVNLTEYNEGNIETVEYACRAGAEWMCKELTRWRDPKKELPADDACVICKVNTCDYIEYLVLNWDKGIWWTYAAGVSDDEGWHIFSGIVLGWRPIHEKRVKKSRFSLHKPSNL